MTLKNECFHLTKWEKWKLQVPSPFASFTARNTYSIYTKENLRFCSYRYVDYVTEDYAIENRIFWVNVTISKLNRQDQGTYTCVAKNPAGIIERNVSISVESGGIGRVFDRTNIGDLWVLLLCLVIGTYGEICSLFLISLY